MDRYGVLTKVSCCLGFSDILQRHLCKWRQPQQLLFTERNSILKVWYLTLAKWMLKRQVLIIESTKYTLKSCHFLTLIPCLLQFQDNTQYRCYVQYPKHGVKWTVILIPQWRILWMCIVKHTHTKKSFTKGYEYLN